LCREGRESGEPKSVGENTLTPALSQGAREEIGEPNAGRLGILWQGVGGVVKDYCKLF
jgi:hypothetical protein